MKIGDRVEILACGNCSAVGRKCPTLGKIGEIESYMESFDRYFVNFKSSGLQNAYFRESDLKTIETA